MEPLLVRLGWHSLTVRATYIWTVNHFLFFWLCSSRHSARNKIMEILIFKHTLPVVQWCRQNRWDRKMRSLQLPPPMTCHCCWVSVFSLVLTKWNEDQSYWDQVTCSTSQESLHPEGLFGCFWLSVYDRCPFEWWNVVRGGLMHLAESEYKMLLFTSAVILLLPSAVKSSINVTVPVSLAAIDAQAKTEHPL